MPVARPDIIISLFFKLSATTGTKGGEQINAVEDIITVSPSILNNFDSNACKNNDPKTAKTIYNNKEK